MKCHKCGGTDFLHIPDSLAHACKACGGVMVGCGEHAVPGVSLQDWAKDLYEAKQRKEEAKRQKELTAAEQSELETLLADSRQREASGERWEEYTGDGR